MPDSATLLLGLAVFVLGFFLGGVIRPALRKLRRVRRSGFKNKGLLKDWGKPHE